MRTSRGVFLLIALLWANLSFGQQGTNGAGDPSQYTQLQKLLQKLEKDVENIPFNIKTIATQRISYDSTRLTQQGFKLIKHEFERVFREHGRIKVLALEEFQREKILHVTGTDSSLILSNTRRSASEQENSIRLLELSQQYGIDAFLKGHVQYRDDLGYVATLELISPQSRQVLWSKSLVSKNMEPKEEPYRGKRTLISAGASLLPTGDYTIDGSSYSGEILLLDYTARLELRQSINKNNGGYIGVRGGYHNYRIMPNGEEGNDYEPFAMSVFEVGALFYKTLGEKSDQENEYWLEFYLGPNMLIPSEGPNMFALSQGVNINMAKNLGIVLDVQYLLTPNSEIQNDDQTKNIELNTIGYGLKILLRL